MTTKVSESWKEQLIRAWEYYVQEPDDFVEPALGTSRLHYTVPNNARIVPMQHIKVEFVIDQNELTDPRLREDQKCLRKWIYEYNGPQLARVPERYDGLTADECYERFLYMQREYSSFIVDGVISRPAPLTALQRTVASNRWSNELWTKARASSEKERCQVVCQQEDD